MGLKHESLSIAVQLALQREYRGKIRVFPRHIGNFISPRGMRVRASIPGQSDIWGIIEIGGLGVHFEIEVKVAPDRLTKKQRLWAGEMGKIGAIHIVAKDIDNCLKEFNLAISRLSKFLT